MRPIILESPYAGDMDVKTFEVGYRVGAAYRKARNAARPAPPAQGGSHASPVPHMRAGHWSTYWTGPKNKPEQPQTAVLKWIDALVVGAEDDLVPVVRPVKG